MGNIIVDGVIFAATEFTVILCFLLLSDPVGMVITSLVTAGQNMGINKMTSIGNEVNSVLIIYFIILGVIPIIWFILRMYTREPDWGYRPY